MDNLVSVKSDKYSTFMLCRPVYYRTVLDFVISSVNYIPELINKHSMLSRINIYCKPSHPGANFALSQVVITSDDKVGIMATLSFKCKLNVFDYDYLLILLIASLKYCSQQYILIVCIPRTISVTKPTLLSVQVSMSLQTATLFLETLKINK